MMGCAKSGQREEITNLRSLAAYYSQFLAHNRGRLPANEKDFKNFIKAKGGTALSYKGLSVDDLFVSSRDDKPFVVKYGNDKSWRLADIVIYEQEGRGGTRHAATSIGGYAVMSEEEFSGGKSASIARNR
jgi:hypothetical protein